ncbi:skin secretory protein xP2-like [Agelaius tricolor]|uniref:skin secretory protein xP2-like n=1 Tax=Agelaius tricolor TaxID=9191 RepID=UPI0039F1AB90
MELDELQAQLQVPRRSLRARPARSPRPSGGPARAPAPPGGGGPAAPPAAEMAPEGPAWAQSGAWPGQTGTERGDKARGQSEGTKRGDTPRVPVPALSRDTHMLNQAQARELPLGKASYRTLSFTQHRIQPRASRRPVSAHPEGAPALTEHRPGRGRSWAAAPSVPPRRDPRPHLQPPGHARGRTGSGGSAPSSAPTSSRAGAAPAAHPERSR